MDSSSAAQVPSPPRLEDLARRTARRLLLPYIIGYVSSSATLPSPSDPPREVALIVNTRTGSLTLIEGGIDGQPFPQPPKDAIVPASRESIESMPTVKVAELGFDCVICLSEFEMGEEAKLMPCNHKFHGPCIDEWLGIQGSCPICRYRMPVEEGGGDNGGREAEEEEDGEEGAVGVDVAFLSRLPNFVFHIYFSGRNQPSTDAGPELQSGEANASDDVADMVVDGGSTSPEMEMDIDDDNVTP